MESTDNQPAAPEGGPNRRNAGRTAASGIWIATVVLFAVTKNGVWLAIGVALGAGVGVAVNKTGDNHSNTES